MKLYLIKVGLVLKLGSTHVYYILFYLFFRGCFYSFTTYYIYKHRVASILSDVLDTVLFAGIFILELPANRGLQKISFY